MPFTFCAHSRPRRPTDFRFRPFFVFSRDRYPGAIAHISDAKSKKSPEFENNSCHIFAKLQVSREKIKPSAR
jgi:hypothetical protein